MVRWFHGLQPVIPPSPTAASSCYAAALARSKGRLTSRAMRCTVPVPPPHSRAIRQHALTGPQLSLDLLFSGGADLGPSELLASFYCPFKPSADSLADHAALELGEGTCYSELMRGGIYEGSSFDCCAFERGAGWLRTKARAAWATGSSRHPRRTGSSWPNWGAGRSWPSRARRPARAPRRAGSHRPRIAGSSRGENCFL
jgi:hypothetical protein